MRHALAICLLLLAQVNITFAHTPAYTIGGFDNWMVSLSPEQYCKFTQPYEIPARTSVRIELRQDTVFTKPGFLYAGAVYGSASKKRFVLVNVEKAINEAIGVDQTQYRTWPHLGLLYVGTVAHQEGWEVVLWDELVQGYAPLDRLVEPGDIVGLSLVVTGIERGVVLANEAKRLGARAVVAGNDSATFRANQMLQLSGQPVDAVFMSNSLAAIRSFFRTAGERDIAMLRIPRVQTKPGAEPRSNLRETLVQELAERRTQADASDVFVVPEFNLFPPEYWAEIWRNYRVTFGHKHQTQPTNAMSLFAQGCTRAATNDVCSYCTIADVANVQVPDMALLEQMVAAYHNFGIDTVFNTTDSVYEMRRVAQMLRQIGQPFNAMTIYGRAWGLANHPELLDAWLACVNDRLLVNVGMDSGDDRMLSSGIHKATSQRGSRLSENRQAVEVIKASEAHLHYSLIFGSPGETLETCERSIEFLEWTVARLGPQLDLVETDVYWLNFGAPASRVFTDYRYAQELAALAGREISSQDWQQSFAQHREALVVPESVERAWYQYFTSIDYDTAQQYNERAARIMAAHTGSIRGRAYKPIVS